MKATITFAARIIGNPEFARDYAKSQPEIEWTVTNAVCVDGYGRRVGIDTETGAAIYRLTGFRFPHLTGAEVVVRPDGELMRHYNRKPVYAYREQAEVEAVIRHHMARAAEHEAARDAATYESPAYWAAHDAAIAEHENARRLMPAGS